MRTRLSILALSLAFAGCSLTSSPSTPSNEDPSVESATSYMSSKNYSSAIKVLELFRSEHPLSPKIPQVEKLLIECYSQIGDYPLLQAATDRFLYEHHEDSNRDYVAYLRFDALMHQAQGYPYAWLPIDRSLRDVSRFKDAFIAGKNFLRDYPQSAYAPNIAHALPSLKETIARYYFLKGEMLSHREEPIGAIRAYQAVLSDFKDTSYATPAQHSIDKFSKKYALVRTISFNQPEPEETIV